MIIIFLPNFSSASRTAFVMTGVRLKLPIMASMPLFTNASSMGTIELLSAWRSLIMQSSAGERWLQPAIQLVPINIRGREMPATVVLGKSSSMFTHILFSFFILVKTGTSAAQKALQAHFVLLFQ